jgi:hypothetical protein
MSDINLKNFLTGQVSKQEVVNFAVREVYKQGRASAGPNSCLYRGTGGRKCAIGHLIPDEEYNSEMDSPFSHGIGSVGIDAGALVEKFFAKKYDISPTSEDIETRLEFLNKLQMTHDRAHWRSIQGDKDSFNYHFEQTVIPFCIEENLTYPLA